MDAAPGSWAEIQERPRRHRRPLAVLQLRGPLRHARARRRRAPRERNDVRFAAGVASGRKLAGAARTVSARFLLARHGWSHRRSQGGVERAWRLRGLWTERRLARRRWPGD